MIRYPAGYNPIKEYQSWIHKHPDKVGKKLKAQIDKLTYDLNKKGSDVYYDSEKANHALEFIENYCRNIKGKTAGQLVKLDLWEKAFVGAIFGICYKKTGLRRTKRAVMIIAKKNGKSLLAGAIGLYMLAGDGEGGAECYSVATKKDQAKIVWDTAKKMIPKDKHLKKYLKPLVGEIDCLFNDGKFKPLASDADTLDGLDIHFVAMDEFHQWKNGYDLYDIMYRGMDNREQPLALLMSTAGTIREDLYDTIYTEATQVIRDYYNPQGFKADDTIYFIYELDDREEWQDWDKLIKANPGLGTIRNEVSLRQEWQRAKNNPEMYLKMFLTKNCNIPETSAESWLSSGDIENPATFDIDKLKPDYVIGGVDMSSTTDLTCVTFLFMIPDDETIYVDQLYFIPEDTIDDKQIVDKVPYKKWAERGHVILTPGNKIDQEEVWAHVQAYAEKHEVVLIWSGFDMWGADLLAKRWREAYGKNSVEAVIQGYKTRSSPMKSLKADLQAKRINYNNNPVLKWNLANTAIKTDNNNNIDPIKGKSRLLRIDGTVSLLNAYIALIRHEENYKNLI